MILLRSHLPHLHQSESLLECGYDLEGNSSTTKRWKKQKTCIHIEPHILNSHHDKPVYVSFHKISICHQGESFIVNPSLSGNSTLASFILNRLQILAFDIPIHSAFWITHLRVGCSVSRVYGYLWRYDKLNDFTKPSTCSLL